MAIQPFEVLVPVVEVRRHLRVGPEAGVDEDLRQPRGPVVELPPRVPPLALHERDALGQRVAHRLPHGRQVPVQHDSLGPRTIRAVFQHRYGGRMPPGGQQRIPRPPSYRPGRPCALGAPRARGQEADPRAGTAPARPAAARGGPGTRRLGQRRRRGARARVRGRRRGARRAHEAPRHDAVAPGRDRVPRRQVRPRARLRPARHGAAGGRGGDRARPGRGRGRRAPRGDLDGRVALHHHAVRRVPPRPAAPPTRTRARSRGCWRSRSPT
ncbi:MAG: hypothetical protein KatS3mg010_1303 [Acidimicrobiia bacterium]|nr:MAG: hypothetical protein KatS3mg010_1303 [Acidimicrobiia bacterium]